jgi:hypothetical protein
VLFRETPSEIKETNPIKHPRGCAQIDSELEANRLFEAITAQEEEKQAVMIGGNL